MSNHSTFIKTEEQADTIHSIKEFGFEGFTELEKAIAEKRNKELFSREFDDQSTTAYFRAVDYKGDLNEELKTAAQKMFDKAKATLAQAESEAEALKRSAFEEGYEEGCKEGMEKGMEDAKKSVAVYLNLFQKGIEDISSLRDEVFHKSESEIVEMILKIARKVVHSELMINREVVLNVIKAAIRNILQKEKMTIRINPEDFDYAVSCKPDLQEYVEDLKNVVMEKDDTIARGGCIVISETGRVDAQIDNSMEEVEDMLRKTYQKQGL
ncbi:MAG: hypothetical protein HQK84_02955 [Nitrospinae bacterium]|nr:hypothetical protein [Nitrospinota bacterium]